MSIKLENAADHLRSHNISPSYPRKRILEYLIQHHNHPSVNTIYDDLIGEIPTLSKTTVYNTLRLFVEHEIVEELTIDDTEKRYDLFNAEDHGHFRCNRCGEVYDIDLSIDTGSIPALANFVVHRQSIRFTGLCPACSSQSPS